MYLVYEPLGCIIFYPLGKVVEAVGIGDMSLSVADIAQVSAEVTEVSLAVLSA